MSGIKSYLITEQSNSNESNKEVMDYFKSLGFDTPDNPNCRYILLRTEINNRHYFCCMSGGRIINNEPHLTFIGRKTLEALLGLKVPSNQNIVFQEIFLGRTPLRKKLINMLSKHPSGTKVCFVGDMTGSLDGVLFQAFNVRSRKGNK